MTQLHLAASWSHAAMTELLLYRGAEVNALDARGFTPLQHAIAMENTEVKELLLEIGAPKFVDRVHSSREPDKGFSR